MSEPTTYLRLPRVLARTGLTRSTLYEMMARGTFPRQRKISQRSVAWREDEIEAWCSACTVGAPPGVLEHSDAA